MILLDTCSLLWLAGYPEGLSSAARMALANPGIRVCFSPVSVHEIGIKSVRGKLSLPLPLAEWIEGAAMLHGLEEIPMNCRIAIRASALPELHRDPFDRLLIATAQEHRLTLLTPDDNIRQYPDLKTVW
ncbi:MAG: type II toxin-antitoxin system VapC family toxin [Opitutus sp.]